jgi:hypothetical protein
MSDMNYLTRVLSLTVFCTVLLPGTTLASHDSADMAALLAELETNRRAIVAENMNLPENQAAAFWSVYDEYRIAMGELEKEGLMLLREFHEHFEEVTDERANQIMAAYFSREAKELQVREKFVPRFNEALSAKQTLRLYQIENKLEAIIQADISSVTPLVPE